MWPNVEVALIAWLNANLAVRAATDIPGNVGELPGFVAVSRGPGSDDGITDEPLIDVEAFAPTRLTAGNLAEQVRQSMHAATGQDAGGHLIDSVTTASGPSWVFYGPNVQRYVASYRVGLRKPR